MQEYEILIPDPKPCLQGYRTETCFHQILCYQPAKTVRDLDKGNISTFCKPSSTNCCIYIVVVFLALCPDVTDPIWTKQIEFLLLKKECRIVVTHAWAAG